MNETQTSTQYEVTPLELMREYFNLRKERNSSYSLSSFARDLGISRSQLYRVMTGQRPVTMKLAMQTATALDLSEKESNQLLLCVVQSSSKNAKISKKIRLKLQNDLKQKTVIPFTTLEIEHFKAMASWHHMALLNLVRLDSFENNTLWMAKKLGITVVEVQEALERLFSIGLLTEANGEIKRTSKSLYLKTNKSEFAVRKFHEQMIEKAKDELTKTSAEDFQKRLINAITFTCSQEHVELIKDKIIKLQDEIFDLIATGESHQLYQMNVQLFPLTKTSNEANQGE